MRKLRLRAVRLWCDKGKGEVALGEWMGSESGKLGMMRSVIDFTASL